jgi:hypothetical protein
VQMIRKVIELKSAEISQTAQLALSLEERWVAVRFHHRVRPYVSS